MTMRLLATTALVGGLSLTLSPTPVEAVPSFPIVFALHFDWGCTGSPGTTSLTVEDTGRFMTGDGFAGDWTFVGASQQIRFLFDTGTDYRGEHLGGGNLEGTMQSVYGSDGCWTANL